MKGLTQNGFRFVILRNFVTKELSFEGFSKLSERFSAYAQNDTAF